MAASAYDPDGQMPMPFQAADDYARQVMAWAADLDTSGMVVQRDVAYGEHRLQRYDVYAPPDARGAPVVVFFHGGGWTNGYRAYQAFMAPWIVAMGAVMVAPSYRLSPQYRLSDAFDDSLAALRHIAGHAEQWGGDGQRLVLAGHSAGGHLAALAALRSADRNAAGVPEGAVRACLPISGIMDLYHPAPQPGSLEERVYTMVLPSPELDAVFSPLCWTVGNTVPFVLCYGEQDSERVLKSNRRLAQLLALQPGPVAEECFADHDHFRAHTALVDPTHRWYWHLASALRLAQD